MSDQPEIMRAFPSPMQPDWSEGCPGMDLRDWFAGQALVGLARRGMPLSMGDDLAKYYVVVSQSAYHFADAMLAARTSTAGER